MYVCDLQHLPVWILILIPRTFIGEHSIGTYRNCNFRYAQNVSFLARGSMIDMLYRLTHAKLE